MTSLVLKNLINDEQSLKLIQQLKEHCSSSKVDFKNSTLSTKDSTLTGYKINLSGPGWSNYEVGIYFPKDLEKLDGINLKNLFTLENFEGICSIDNNIIEVAIAGTNIFGFVEKEKLFKTQNPIVLKDKTTEISIGECSKTYKAIFTYATTDTVTLRIKNVTPKNSVEAENCLKTYTSKLFIDILDSIGVGLKIKRRLRKGIQQSISATSNAALNFPKEHYPFESSSLFLTAQSFRANPSVKFFFLYQSLEFLFFRANRSEAISTIQKITTDAGFDPKNNEDIKKIIKAMKKAWVNPLSDELNQLTQLLTQSLNVQEVWHHIDSDNAAKEHLSQTNKFSNTQLITGVDEKSFIRLLATRIYQIRNSIVHSKEDGSGTFAIFLPDSNDEEIIDLDGIFLNYIVRKTLEGFKSPI